MSQNAFVKALKMIVQRSDDVPDRQDQTQTVILEGKSRFSFKPGKSVTEQLNSFKLRLKNNRWNNEISVQNYQGTFKVEHWIYIEQSLRSLPNIKLLQFISTQLDKEHLNVLGRLINWLTPQDFELILEQNEIDDLDVEEFLYDILKNRINFKKIYIISNPGIYKSHFLQQLDLYLVQNQNQNSQYYYQLIKNEKMHSIAIIKIRNNNADDQNAQLRQETLKDIDKTCFYDLNLANCFDESNYQAFYNLIELLYHEDHLEQLVGLNIDNNFLGDIGEFSKACSQFSTSKGLLKLEVADQPLLHNSVSCESLCGNRYDQFRINQISIKNNVKMSAKAFELLSYRILGDLKLMNLDDSLPAELPTLLKIFYLIDSYEKKIQELQRISNETKILHKLNLQELDLSKLENYNRHDLMYKLIKTTCFNFHSNVSKLSISNCDAGRMEAYYKAYDDFVKEIQKNKNSNIYGNFKIPLQEIVIPTQRYSMQTEINYNFFKKLIFTTEDDCLQLKKVTFEDQSFNIYQRNDAFNQILDEILVKENVKYTLKEFKGVATSHTLENNHIKALIFNKNLQLESLTLNDTSVSVDCDFFEENLVNHIKELSLNNQLYSLKALKLMNCYGMQIELYSLLHHLVFSEVSQLEEFQIFGISISTKQENKESLLQYLGKSQQSIRRLKKLDIGQLVSDENNIYPDIIQYLILNQYIRLNELIMSDIPFSDYLETIVQTNIDLNDPNHQLSQITSLTLNQIAFTSQKQWKLFIQHFLFNGNSQLQHLYFKQILVSDKLQKGFQEVFEELQPKFEKEGFKIRKKLRSLKLEQCEIQTEFLISFILNPFCKLEELIFINCTDFDKYLMQTKNLIGEFDLKSSLTLSLNTFKAINTGIQDAFEWFLSDIIFNEYKQKIQSLTLQNCQLTDKNLQILCKIIQQLKQNQQNLGQMSRKFQLKDIDLSRNSNISNKQWNSLFSLILDVKQNDQTIQLQEETPEEQSELEERINKIQENVIQSNLGMHDKILNQPQKFNFMPPTQLKLLDLDLNLTLIKEHQQNQLYKALVCGIIIHPLSNLQKLKLSNLNLEYFMTYVEEYFTFCKWMIKNDEQSLIFKLNDLEILGITEESQKNVQQFVSYFICSQHINLTRLSLSGFQQGIIGEILNQSSQKEKYYLKQLLISEISESLSRENSIKFIRQIIFGSLFPIEILEFGENLNFEGKITTKDWNDTDQYTGQLQLQKLQIYSGGYDVDKLDTIVEIMNQILSNPNIKLEQLVIKGTGYECRCFDKFYEKGINLMKKLPIKILRIENTVCLDENFIKLLSKLRYSLTELKLDTSLSSCVQTKEALNEVFDPFKQNCKLYINEIQGDEDDKKMIQEDFCFSKQFGFNNISYKHLGSFEYIAIGQSYKHLKRLEFAFNLFYNDYQQLNEEALELVGDKFIYNLESQLEELVFHQCHFKPAGLRALTSKANAFRSEMEKQGKQQIAQLSLKRFNIYYSLYIEEEGAILINTEILFFEYISIERLELEVTNWANDFQIDMCKKALNWLKFQKQFKRTHINYLPLKYFDIGRNEFVQTEEAWKLICQTFLFSDLTPQLEIVYIHFMALTDAQVEIITNQARIYFNSKSSSYIYQVKRLDFSFNSSLTYKGWLDVSKNLFFHPKVELVELNISNTSLDNEQKISNIVNSAIQKALTKPNKKLTLHTLLTYNSVVKQHLYKYLSPQPENYGPPEDIPVEIDYEMADVGWFGGIPEEFGYINQLQSNLVYNNEKFKTQEWSEAPSIKFSQYHFSIGFNYIKILNDHYLDLNQSDFTLYFDLNTLDQFCTYFKYTTKKPGQPYPYALLFQEDTFQQLKQSNSIVSKINIISSKVEGLEKIQFSFIIYIWENIKTYQSSIDQIIVDYYLDDDLIDYMFDNGYTERDIVQLVRLIPPSKIRIQNSLSLQAIKAMYSIFYDTTNFEYSSIQYDFDNFLNIGIGYALREVAYSMRPIGCRRYLKKIMYPVCDFFVQQTKEYKFNSEVTELNKFLAHQQIFLFLLVLNNIAFLGICILSPYFFSHYYVSDTSATVRLDYCINGPNKIAGYLYYSFAFVSLILEGYIYRRVIEFVPSFLEKLQIKIYPNEEEQLDNELNVEKKEEIKKEKKKSVLQSAQTKFDQFANSSQGYWIIFFKTIITSQLAKYDQFNDICFVLTCYYCDEMILFYLVLALQIFIQFIHIFGFFNQVIVTIISKRSNNKQLSTQFINEFYRISLAGKNLALAQMLDQVAPFNVDIIPNNFITRFLMPKQAGKAINSSIKGYLIQFTFEDMPQIIILIIFLIRQAIKNGVLKWNIIVTLITSTVAVINSFYKFMSIRPTYLSQDNFDDLSQKKSLSKKELILKQLNNEQEQIEIFCNLNKKSETLININESAPLL